jgi:hypothetical protein
MRKVFVGVLVAIGAALCGGLGVVVTGLAGSETGETVHTMPEGTPRPIRSARPGLIVEGVWEVGMAGGVSAGTYRVSQPLDENSTCYWAIMSGPGDETGDIIKNDIATGGTPQVTVKKGQWFKTSGCGTWELRR